MMQYRPSHERGGANFGWLESYHSFSFGSYHDPNHTNHGSLRVINEDYVQPGQGFGTHPHRNMEILSYVIDGAIAHKDSEGNEYQVPAGDFQLMSAGKGITHSEFNPSKTQALNFLQIWIMPNVTETEPGYQQKAFVQTEKAQLIFSPDGADGSLNIKQNAWLHRVRLSEGEDLSYPLVKTPEAYIHMVKGEVSINQSQALQAGDGLKISAETELVARAKTDNVEFLLFEV
ncbi:pirin family protein [Planctobacterium marinum]|uniref:pirin family protein n=1 Tax=Planctobacterium marinum TaxID=1631968 RepID=UPI001E493F34|nr:pirin family protein [Planctobacterium marinum]MCC2605760.1 pirin family protein [Planctobacterium marinum]